MPVSTRPLFFACAGALFAATSVAAGAFGAHALKSILDPQRWPSSRRRHGTKCTMLWVCLS
ncbi:MAG: hypothetical protein MRJ92_05325 [Nitrospira sp.]|nr:hypothetical protein [Nitrospira sp.]